MNTDSSSGNGNTQSTGLGGILTIPVIVAALGYFVDIYDLLLFSIVRVPSLRGIGLDGQELLESGVLLLNSQMAGMLVGGIFWGVMGDKKGRIKILFGSILIYSLANIINGMVETVPQYVICRFLAGLGLAGELGAGITLVLETLPQETRGYGTMVVAGVGVAGAVLANFVANLTDWRTAYYIGGGLGMLLLLLRLGVFESGLYREMEKLDVPKGAFLSLFTDRSRLVKYASSTLIGLPLWYAVGILVTFSPEMAKNLGITGTVSAGNAIMYTYLGLVIGDFLSGFLSQYLKTRKKVVLGFMMGFWACTIWYFSLIGSSAQTFYIVCLAIGIASGYWAVFVTMAAEQFGSNMRATVATTVPNFIRGTVIPMTTAFTILENHVGVLGSAAVIGVIVCSIALVALTRLEETYHKDLNYLETV